MPNSPAARINDKIQHTQAQSYRAKGMAVGMVIGVVIGTGLVIAAAAAAEFFSFGLATPLVAVAVAATVAVAETAVIAGTGLATGAAISDSAADRGRNHREDDGVILTGVPTIFIGGKDLMAAYSGSKATCKRHKHSPPATVEIVAQGSASVLIGPGRDPAARVNDQVTCQAIIGTGCTTVTIGGPTTTCYKIDGHGDDPDQERFDKLGKYGGYAALIGGAVLAIPAGMAGGGIMAGLRAGTWVLGKGLAIMGGTSYALDHWVHNEQTRHDIASALAIFMPFADHAAGAAKGAFGGGRGGGGSTGGGGDTGGGSTGGSGDAGGGSTGGGGKGDGTGGGGDTPPTAANDNNAGGGKPPEPANDNNAGGSPTAPGDPVQQIGPHDGGAPGDAPPDDAPSDNRPPTPANDNTPGSKPPTPAIDDALGSGKPPTAANDDVLGGARDAAPSDDTAGETTSGETSSEPTEQTGSSDGGASGEAPPEQAEDGSAGKGSEEAAAGEADPTVQTKDSPGGEEDPAGKSDADDATETPEQQAERLKAAVKPRVDEVAAGKVSKTGNPCQSGILDTRTGEIFLGRNTRVAPQNLHPVLRTRLDAYLERTGGITPERAGNLQSGFSKGMHAELNALNDALNAREALGLPATEANLGEFVVQNAKTLGPDTLGDPMPRCANCFNISHGVQVTPEVHAAEVDFYHKEYGPDFMDNIAKIFQGP